MFPSQSDILMKQEQYKDLLQEAKQERLILTIDIRQPSLGGMIRKIANWLGDLMVKWGTKLQSYASTPFLEANSLETIG